MSTESITQKQFNFGKQESLKKQRVLNSSIVDSGSDTDSLIDSPLANSSVCALCNVSKHHLGQGELNRYAPSAGFDPFQSSQAHLESSSGISQIYVGAKGGSSETPTTTRRSTRSGARAASERAAQSYRAQNAKGDGLIEGSCFDTLNRIGRLEVADPCTVFDPSGHVIAHHCCAAWSWGVAARTTSVRGGTGGPLDDNFILIGVDKAVLNSLSRKCKYCQSYGASVKCKVDDCLSWYHYPCAVASGAFQDIHSCSILCTPEHRHEAHLLGANSACASCDTIGDLSDLLFCISCGAHYHARCISAHLTVTGEVRAGWQCPDCKVCQSCLDSRDDEHMIICDVCDKGWHTYCLEPRMNKLPSTGWHCASCRTCTECGNKLGLAANANSNTKDDCICSDCQRIRIKNECSICSKDTRDDGPLVKCIKCDASVHSECQQDEIDPIPSDRYHCPKCRLEIAQIGVNFDAITSNDDGQGSLGQGSIFTDEAGSPPPPPDLDLPIDPDMPIETDVEIPIVEPPKIEPEEPIVVVPKKNDNKPPGDKASSKRVPKKGAVSKKGSKIKSKDSSKKTSKRKAPSRAQSMDESTTSGDNVANSASNLEMAAHFKTVVYPASDTFLSAADICCACGSIGARETKESRMVHCLKCAQSYHYYCSGLKNCRIPKNGFVCVHCNDCEICDKSTVNQERDVVSCYDCNKRQHIGCLGTPLPKNWRRGHSIWRCQSCLVCISCGVTGKDSNKFEWKNNMLTCAVCWSKEFCMQCDRHFKEEELILKCRACNRWLHANHEQIYDEQEMLLIVQQQYQCVDCRPKDKTYKTANNANNEVVVINDTVETQRHDEYQVKTQEKDGVIFTEAGIGQFNRELLRVIGSKRRQQSASTQKKSESNDFAPNSSPSHTDQTSTEQSGSVLSEIDTDKDKSTQQPNKQDKRTRKACRPGIGGFFLRSRKTFIKLDESNKEAIKKTVKKKKSKISDIYPQYIQDAFFLHDEKPVDVKGEPIDSDAMPPVPLTPVTVKSEISDPNDFFQDPFKVTPAVKTEVKFETEDDYLENEYCVLELDSDLPECSAPADDLVDADMPNWLPDDFDDDDLDIDDLVNDLDDFNSDSEGEKVEEKQQTPSQSPVTQQPVTPMVQFKPPGEIGLSPRAQHAGRPFIGNGSSATPPGVQPGQIIYNSMGQVIQVAPPSPASPHISPQIVRQVVGVPNQGGTASTPQGEQFPAGFISPRRVVPQQQVSQGQQAPHGRIQMVQQIKSMNSWNDSRGVKIESKSENTTTQSSSSAKNMDKWRQDEALGDKATISPVLYANKMHPNLKVEHPEWSSRQKQIQRLWRRISQEDRAPFLTQARENRHKQKALNSAKNSGRQRLGSSGPDRSKKEAVSTPVQLPVPGQVPAQMASVATVVGGAPTTTAVQPIIQQQTISSPLISASPQIIQATPSSVCSTTTTDSPKTQQQQDNDWKQFVVPFDGSSSSPKPSASPNQRVIPSPSGSTNTCPSPSTSSTPLIGDPFISQAAESNQQNRSRHPSHDFIPNSPMNMLSPHSPMPPPMSPMSEQFSSPPPPRQQTPQQVQQQAATAGRFHQNGAQNGGTPQPNQQVQLQVQISQQAHFDMRQPQIHQQAAVRHVTAQGQLIQQPGPPPPHPAQQGNVLVDHQMLKNIERKERMRQIEQQRSGTGPHWAPTQGQIIMNSQFPVSNGQNGAPVTRFINQAGGQYATYPPNVRFVQNSPGQIRMMRPQQVHHYSQQAFPMAQQQPMMMVQSQAPISQSQPMSFIQQPETNPDSFLASPATPQQKSPSSLVDQYINDPSTTPKSEEEKQITINGKIQIEPVSSTTASFPTGVGINIAPKMNSNFSNNASDEQNSSDQEKSAADDVKQIKESAPPVTIPQLDGFVESDSEDEIIPQFDGAEDEKQSATQATQPIVLSKDRTKSPQKHTQLKLVLGDKAKKVARDGQFRFTSQGGAIPPRNISPKPKENSPKSGTIVATAKVTKPSSPSSHGGSPQQRPSRMMSPGSLRSVTTSPSRSLSPGSTTPIRNNTSNSSNRASDNRIRVQGQPPRQLGNIKLQIVSPGSLGVKITPVKDKQPASKDPASKQQPLLIREQPLIIEDMIKEEIALKERGTDTDQIPKIPPPPADSAEPDEILQAKMKIYQKVQQQQQQRAKNQQQQGQAKSIRLPNSPGSSAGSSPNSKSQGRKVGTTIKSVKAAQSIVIKTDSKKGTTVPVSSAQSSVTVSEMLRQIQSERNPEANKTLTFNGKTGLFPSLQNTTLQRRQGEANQQSGQRPAQGIPVAICQPGGQIRTNQSFAITVQKQPDQQVLKAKKTPIVTPVKVNNRAKSAQNRKDQKAKNVSSAPGSVKRIYQTQTTKTPVSQTQGAELAYFQTTPAQAADQRTEYRRLQQESENSEAQNALIERLLNAEKVDLQKGTPIKGITPVSVASTQLSKIEHVSISELKTLGISLQQSTPDQAGSSGVNSPVSSVKSEGSGGSSSNTPTQLLPTQPGDVKQEIVDSKPSVEVKKLDLKTEFKDKTPLQNQKGVRKRKQSVDTKSSKKRKLKQEEISQGGGAALPPLTLAEAPIRRNIDSLPPLGGGTISKLGREWDGLGKKHWIQDWNFGGLIQSSLHFYDAFSHFDKFYRLNRLESVPKLVNLREECDDLKNSFSIVVSDDEGAESSDDDDEDSTVDELQTPVEDASLLPPPTAVDFPVAPSSPEIRENDYAFSFIERSPNDTKVQKGDEEIPELGNGKDPVTVTLTFHPGNDHNIEQALKTISNIVGDAIVDFTMTPDARKRDSKAKDELKAENQVTFCKKCSLPIFGHLNAGVTHKTNQEFEYCTMSCLKIDTAVKEDMGKVKAKTEVVATVEKKCSYRRKLFKIAMNDLIEREAAKQPSANCEKPENEDYLKSPLKKAVYSNVLGRGAVRMKKQDEEVKLAKQMEHGVKSYWSYWNNTFTCPRSSQTTHRENPARLELNEQIDTPPGDTRQCYLCKAKGDKTEAGRLLFFERGKWLHVNCVIWNSTVVELKAGGLLNVQRLVADAIETKCVFCKQPGASVCCSKARCEVAYHFGCGRKNNATFHVNKSTYCPSHTNKNESVATLANHRKLFVQSDEISQVLSAFDGNEIRDGSVLRYGNVRINSVGQIIPDIYLASPMGESILPVGLNFTKRFWSTEDVKRRVDYSISISASQGQISYKIKVNGVNYQWCQALHDELAKLFSTVNKTRAVKNLFDISTRPTGLVSINILQLKKVFASLPWRAIMPRDDHFNNQLDNAFARCEDLENSKRFCADYEPSAESLVSQYRTLVPDHVVLKRPEGKKTGLYAQKSFETNELITEYIGDIRPISNTESPSPSLVRIGTNLCIDGAKSVCSCRYLSHSDTPNCEFCLICLPDEARPRLVLKSTQKLIKGDQLTIQIPQALHVR